MLEIPAPVLKEIHQDGEQAYPEEGAGFLLGTEREMRQVQAIIRLGNAREANARHNRYLITPQEMLQAELESARRGMQLLGVLHSHPDHPNQPSPFDLEWALPYFSYIITSVENGKATQSRAWKLREDRSGFDEEEIQVMEDVRKGA